MPDKDKHFADNAGILKKIKSVLGLNIGTMLFGALFLYMLFSVVLYLTSSNIESYLVIAGPLSRNETYTGLAIRTEKVYKAETGGYVSYYAREGSKINANGVVYGISSSQKTEASAELSSDDLSAIRSQMLSFSRDITRANLIIHTALNIILREVSYSMRGKWYFIGFRGCKLWRADTQQSRTGWNYFVFDRWIRK